MALDWENIIVEDDENSQVQDTPVTIMTSGTPGQPISWDKIVIVEEETTVEGEDESVMIFASGIPGHSATIDEVTAETLPEGSEATVENVGTSDNARFHFGIPRGNTGEKGGTGDKGDKGDKGDAGIGSAEYDAENERVIFNGVDENEVYTIDETDALLDEKLDASKTSELSGSIVTFEAENDHAIKDLTVGIEPVQDLHGYSNPWPAGGGKNIFDASITPINAYINEGNIIGHNDNRSVILPIKPSTTYTMSGSHVLLGSSKDDFNVAVFSTQPTIGSTGGRMIFAAATNPMSVTFTTTAEENWIAIKVANITKANYEETVATIQIESGSSATSYAPYSNICPITGWNEVKVTRTGKNLIDAVHTPMLNGYISGSSKITESSPDKTLYFPVELNTIYTVSFTQVAKSTSTNRDDMQLGLFSTQPAINSVGVRLVNQSRTSATENYNFTYTFNSENYPWVGVKICNTQRSDLSETLATFQLELGSSASEYESYQGNEVTVDLGDTRYGGILDVTTGEMTIINWERDFTGTENWQVAYSRMYFEFTAYIPPNNNNKKLIACSHYKTASANGTYDNRNTEGYIGCAVGYTNNKGRVYIIDNVNNPTKDVAILKSYLAEQYANNTPLTVVYELGTPIIIQLTQEEVSTLIGENHLWADTGDSTVTLRLPTGDLAYQDTVDYETQVTNKPDFASMLSGTESTMKATKNYSAGALIAVGDDLYKALSAISSGTTLTVGSNVTATTIEAELALKANSTDVTTALALKANSADVYTKAEVDALVESEITAYHDDTKATVITETASGSIVSITDGSPAPVTSLTVGIEPVQDLHGYDNPWPAGGGKNLLKPPTSGATIRGVTFTVNTDGTITANGGTSTGDADFYFVGAQGVYQSANIPTGNYIVTGNSGAMNVTTIHIVRKTGSEVICSQNADVPVSVSLDENEQYRIFIRIHNGKTVTNQKYYPMIRLASVSDATFAPYSNICPISGWDEAVVTRSGKNLYNPATTTVGVWLRTDNGQTESAVAYWTSDFIPVKAGESYFATAKGSSRNWYYDKYKNPVSYYANSGGSNPFVIPSGISFIRITGQTATIAYDGVFQFELSSSATTYKPYQGTSVIIDLDGTRYGGVLDVLMGEMTVDRASVTIDGSEGWSKSSLTDCDIYMNASSKYGNLQYETLLSHFKFVQGSSTVNTVGCAWRGSSTSQLRIGFSAYGTTTVTDFTTWLSANPVQIVTHLATPLTVQLSPSTIQTLLGQNHIWSDTGDTSVEYRADTKLFIEKLTKPTEDDMTANANIAANTFFMVGNSLYYATSAIATGTTIVPGSNCTALSLADALNNLNA